MLERDTAPVPESVDEAWEWSRDGVSQFRMAHFLQPAVESCWSRTWGIGGV